MIAYKVVTKDRKSIISALPFCYKPMINRFVLTYNKGDIIEAPKGTQGIVTFLRKRNAENWMEDIKRIIDVNESMIIIRITSLEKGCRKFYNATFNELAYLFEDILCKRHINWNNYHPSFIGDVVCFPKVKVLD